MSHDAMRYPYPNTPKISPSCIHLQQTWYSPATNTGSNKKKGCMGPETNILCKKILMPPALKKNEDVRDGAPGHCAPRFATKITKLLHHIYPYFSFFSYARKFSPCARSALTYGLSNDIFYKLLHTCIYAVVWLVIG